MIAFHQAPGYQRGTITAKTVVGATEKKSAAFEKSGAKLFRTSAVQLKPARPKFTKIFCFFLFAERSPFLSEEIVS
jgi:hypothetical protein